MDEINFLYQLDYLEPPKFNNISDVIIFVVLMVISIIILIKQNEEK